MIIVEFELWANVLTSFRRIIRPTAKASLLATMVPWRTLTNSPEAIQITEEITSWKHSPPSSKQTSRAHPYVSPAANLEKEDAA
jgi:hypothetical protein